MALTTLTPAAVAGVMSPAKALVYTYTTVGNDYVVLGTVSTARMLAQFFTAAVTTNDLLLKVEYTRDGTNYTALVTDFPVAKAASTSFSMQHQALYTRISVKPAVAATHGTVVLTWLLSDLAMAPEISYAFGYESLTITNAVAVALTQATYDAARQAVITIEDNPVRVRWDGTAPTTTEGHLFSAGDSITLQFSADIFHFRAIATAGNAKIRVTYSR
jgi:hypothetical protein